MSKHVSEICNRRAYYDYFVEDKLECGISLTGNEIKSILAGKVNIVGAWITIQNNELVLRGCHIDKWDTANLFDVDEDRERKLLAHKNEIRKLIMRLKLEGITLIPLRIYFAENGKCKVELGVCKGKKNYDKRASIKERDIKRTEMRKF